MILHWLGHFYSIVIFIFSFHFNYLQCSLMFIYKSFVSVLPYVVTAEKKATDLDSKVYFWSKSGTRFTNRMSPAKTSFLPLFAQKFAFHCSLPHLLV